MCLLLNCCTNWVACVAAGVFIARCRLVHQSLLYFRLNFLLDFPCLAGHNQIDNHSLNGSQCVLAVSTRISPRTRDRLQAVSYFTVLGTGLPSTDNLGGGFNMLCEGILAFTFGD